MMNNLNKFTFTAALLLSVLVPSQAFAAILVSKEVKGSSTPPLIDGSVLQNGDFTITPNVFTDLGDGVDEFTNWTFDFAKSSIQGQVKKAFVDLELKPSSLYQTDGFSITDIGYLELAKFLPLNQVKPGKTQSVQIDLLKFFSPETILTAFNKNQGKLQAGYQDDAIISYAKMTVDVPEPTTTFGLLALAGLAGPLLAKRKS